MNLNGHKCQVLTLGSKSQLHRQIWKYDFDGFNQQNTWRDHRGDTGSYLLGFGGTALRL